MSGAWGKFTRWTFVRAEQRSAWAVPCALAAGGLWLGWARWAHGATELATSGYPWWLWPVGLFGFTAVLGVVTVLAGIGGAVVFVPFVSGFLPQLHLDFVRGAGLMMALAGALAAGPAL